MKSLEVKTEEFQRAELKRMLCLCSAKEVERFWKLYPNGVAVELLPVAHDFVVEEMV